MAIKVSGNTVIDNSRNLVGVSSITFSDGTVQSTASNGPSGGGTTIHEQGDLLFTLTNPDISDVDVDDDFFGSEIAMNDKYIVVSATGEETDIGDVSQGIVYVYDAKTRRRLYTLTPGKYWNSFNGATLELDDDFLAIGAQRFGTSTSIRHTVYIYDLRDGQKVCTIESPNSAVNNPSAYENADYFGNLGAISMKGKYILIGAPRTDSSTYAGGSTGRHQGKAYLYEWASSPTGTLLQEYVQSDTGRTPNDDIEWGSAVALTDSYVIISTNGSPQNGDLSYGHRHIDVFYKIPPLGSGVGYINTINPGSAQGAVVSLSHGQALIANEDDDILIINDYRSLTGSTSSQSTSYPRAARMWKLSDLSHIRDFNRPERWDDPTHYEDVLGGMAYSDGILAIGSMSDENPNDPTNTRADNSVILYDINTGDIIKRIHHPNTGYSGDTNWVRFGEKISISGGTILVSADREDNSVNDNNDGRVYGFALEDIKMGENVEFIEFDNGATLSNGDKIFQPIYHAGQMVHRLYPPTTPDGRFGNETKIYKNYAAVGAYGAGNRGEVYMYDVLTGDLLYTVEPPVSADRQGRDIAINDKYLVTASYNDERVFVYDVRTGNHLVTIDDPNSYANTTGDAFGASIALWDDKLFVGATSEDPNNISGQGVAYVFDLSPTYSTAGVETRGTLLQTLTDVNGDESDAFGLGISTNGKYVAIGARNAREPSYGSYDFGTVCIFDYDTYEQYASVIYPLSIGTVGDTDFNFGRLHTMSDKYLVVTSENGFNYNTSAYPSNNEFVHIYEISETSNGALADGTSGELYPTFTLIKTVTSSDLVSQILLDSTLGFVTGPGIVQISSVSIVGDEVVISAYFSNNAQYDSEDTLDLPYETEGSPSGSEVGKEYAGERFWVYSITRDEVIHSIRNPHIRPDGYSTTPMGYDGFRYADAHGNFAIIGAEGHRSYDGSSTNDGMAYIFALKDLTVLDCLTQITKS